MTKFNKEHIKWMKKFRKEGFNYREIGEIIGCYGSSVQYYLKEDYRRRSNERAKKTISKFTKKQIKERNSKRKEYSNEYFYNRYHSDSKFRKQLIELNKESYRKRKALRVKKGLCIVCGGVRDNKRWKSCDKCRKKLREVKRR